MINKIATLIEYAQVKHCMIGVDNHYDSDKYDLEPTNNYDEVIAFLEANSNKALWIYLCYADAPLAFGGIFVHQASNTVDFLWCDDAAIEDAIMEAWEA